MNVATPFTQTPLWAQINHTHNNLEPLTLKHHNVTCLFGLDNENKKLVSYGGPTIATDCTPEDFKSFLKLIITEAKHRKMNAIYFNTLPPFRHWNEEFSSALTTLKFIKEEQQTYIVNLNYTEAELLKNLEHSARKGIKKALNHGVTITACETFDSLYHEFTQPYFELTNKPIKDKSLYKKIWDADTNKVYRYWVAKCPQGNPLAYLGTYTYDGVATEICSAMTPLAFQQKIPAQDILHFEIIKYHKELGDKFFDLACFNPNPTTAKENNIRRFKRKWGGQVYDTPSYRLDLTPTYKKLLRKIKHRLF